MVSDSGDANIVTTTVDVMTTSSDRLTVDLVELRVELRAELRAELAEFRAQTEGISAGINAQNEKISE